jgi:hypothetical protein
MGKLTPAVFFLLLALSDGEKHGDAIRQLVGKQSGKGLCGTGHPVYDDPAVLADARPS